MKNYIMSFFVISVLSLSPLAKAALWQGVRNNTWTGVNLGLNGGTYRGEFTLPSGFIVWTTAQTQLRIQERIKGWVNLNAPEYASYLDQEIMQGRNNDENKYKRPVLSINTTSYSIVWEDKDQFETNVIVPQQ